MEPGSTIIINKIQVNVRETKCMDKIISIFEEASGQSISTEKFKAYFLNVN